VDGIVEYLGDAAIDFNGPCRVATLGTQDNSVEATVFENADVFSHLLHHERYSLRGRDVTLFQVADAGFVYADADGDLVGLCGVDDAENVFAVLYVSRVESNLCGAGFYGFDGPLGAEVNVGDKRNSDPFNKLAKGKSIGTRGNGNADEAATGLGELIYLPYTSGDVGGRYFGHGLYHDRVARAYSHIAYFDGDGFSSLGHTRDFSLWRERWQNKDRCNSEEILLLGSD
jgi:hypothetical protein